MKKINSSNVAILWLLHLPPPVHGSSVVGKVIRDSERFNTSFRCRYINLLASRKLDETGKLNLLKLLSIPHIFLLLIRELLLYSPRLCYLALTTSGFALYRDALLVLLLRVFGIRRVYHLHHKGVSKKKERFLHRHLFKFIFKGADIILLSSHLYADVAAFVPASSIHIVPNGIPLMQEKKELLSKKIVSNPNILFLSNLIASKGVYVLLEACRLLAEKGIDFTCSFVGAEADITVAAFRKQVQEFGLEGRVEYLGKKMGVEKSKVFANADVFALPTFNDALPLVLLEAMQWSLPVVSTPEGGIPDLVVDGQTGFLVPQQDVTALADKLEILLKDATLRKRMGEAGRKHYEQHFTQEKFERNLVGVLAQLAA